jgi:hypothetical protein
MAKGMSFIPAILEAAAQEKDNVKQFQRVVSVLTTGINNIIVVKQPLNPILGETFNGYLGTTEVCYEQISHHPPVSAFNFRGTSPLTARQRLQLPRLFRDQAVHRPAARLRLRARPNDHQLH